MHRYMLHAALAIVAAALLLPGSANAQVNYQVNVANAPVGANDIHLVFTGTGGQTTNRTAIFPAVQNFANTPDIDASFGALAGGETYKAQFTSLAGIQWNSGWWTKDGTNIQAISPNEVTLTPNVPEPSSLLTLAAMGTAFLSRRRLQKR